jgi:hypothetical protein
LSQHSVGPASAQGLALLAQPKGQIILHGPCWPMRQSARGGSHRARLTLGGVPGAGSLETPGRQGRRCEHHRGRGYPPGNLRGVAAHRRAPAMKGRLSDRETVVFDDGGRRAVVGGVPGWSCSNMRRRGDDVHGEVEENQSRMTLTEEGV